MSARTIAVLAVLLLALFEPVVLAQGGGPQGASAPARPMP